MRTLFLGILLAALSGAATSAADCSTEGPIAAVADCTEASEPCAFTVALSDGTVWQIEADTEATKVARANIKEGLAQVCEDFFFGFMLKVKGGGNYLVERSRLDR